MADDIKNEEQVDGLFQQIKTKFRGKMSPSPLMSIPVHAAKDSLDVVESCGVSSYREGNPLVVMINNYNFSCPSVNNRDGAQVDCENLKKAFATCLGVKNMQYGENMTKDQMLSAAKDIAGLKNLKEYSYLLFVISSHGGEGDVVYSCPKSSCKVNTNKCKVGSCKATLDGPCSDGSHFIHAKTCKEKISISELIKPLKKAMPGIPKWFIIQACRGNQLVETTAKHYDVCDGRSHQQSAPMEIMPVEADVLMMFASPPGYYAHRNEIIGSHLIRHLCNRLRWIKQLQDSQGERVEIHRLILEINLRSSNAPVMLKNPDTDEMTTAGIITCITHTLRHNFYIIPRKEEEHAV